MSGRSPPRRSPRLRRAAAFVGLVLASVCGEIARAEPVWYSDVGGYVSYDFGGRRPGHFGFGVELRAMYSPRQFECGLHAARYVGVAARLSLVGGDQLRILLAPQLGLTISLPYPYPPVTAPVGGELGLGYRLYRDPGVFVQPAIEGSFANLVFLRGGHSFGPDRETSSYVHSGSMDLGARLAPSGTHELGGPNCD